MAVVGVGDGLLASNPRINSACPCCNQGAYSYYKDEGDPQTSSGESFYDSLRRLSPLYVQEQFARIEASPSFRNATPSIVSG